MLRELKQIFLGVLFRRKVTMPAELRNAHKLTEALNCIKKRWPQLFRKTHDSESPVFILSAGWRSGSTLMQRLIISSGEVAIWGEPLGEAGIIPRLAQTISNINLEWPSDSYFDDAPSLPALSKKWIANLTPPMSYLMVSHRALLEEWLGSSAKARYGVPRWGLKDVRLTIDHARYLKWLFPNARFIFIYRNLLDAYKSWKGNRWFGAWPGYFSWSPVVFARHWRLLVSGFVRSYQDVDGLIVRFEDLTSGKICLDEIAGHVGVNNLDSSVLAKRIRSPIHVKERPTTKLTPFDRIVLKAIAGRFLQKLGYR
jgi:hypothetical protein